MDIICEFDGLQYSVLDISESHFPRCQQTTETLEQQRRLRKNLVAKNQERNLQQSQSISMETPMDLISLSKSFDDISSIEQSGS